ncbi:DUF3078 domain-containing protein [Aliifodinibius salicampi]|uniref:DUF3078 domain-containing protein n=1 Tax=Fodinibius salicampi TaxID=1920655 RepID=A0ABT3Q3C7_9BACT|nr:DUF3078 domain-containing protein [Fodinibius salicampi]MCW9714513.1 DUF3078 domain-containing protein [Fodinibius salicampi]
MGKQVCFVSILFLILFSSVPALGQEAIKISELLEDDGDISVRDMSRIDNTVVVADTLDGWDARWSGGLNGAQAAYNNWSQGGTNTISVTASTVFNLKYRYDRFAYALDTNLKYGKARIQNEGTRKTDDRFAINNKFSYLFDNKKWSAFANINFSTQFDKGFNYSVPDTVEPELISKTFAPAYFTQVLGIAFTPVDYFSAQAGMAMKETIIEDTSLSERYGLEAGERFRFEPGYSAAMYFEKELFSNIRLISSVETFTNLQRSISSTDVHFSNEIIGEINNFMNMSFQYVTIYDDDYSKKVQIKQVLSAGVSVTIL